MHLVGWSTVIHASTVRAAALRCITFRCIDTCPLHTRLVIIEVKVHAIPTYHFHKHLLQIFKTISLEYSTHRLEVKFTILPFSNGLSELIMVTQKGGNRGKWRSGSSISYLIFHTVHHRDHLLHEITKFLFSKIYKFKTGNLLKENKLKRQETSTIDSPRYCSISFVHVIHALLCALDLDRHRKEPRSLNY